MPSLCDRYRVDDGRGFRLKRHDPGDSAGMSIDKEEARLRLRDGVARIDALQTMLYAQDRWSLLLIFQAMDAAGKDGAIKHVMSGINPQGCQVHAFKAPSPEELDHDFLWRTTRALPERGRIGIFNRSYYEEVLVVRVHPELLKAQKLPPELGVGKGIWKQRYAAIRDHERHLAENGYVIRKFFLNVSKDEQKRRFLERLEEPQKHWKFAPGDIEERRYWDDYQEAYEDAIRATAAPHAPWLVVPADQKWFTRLVVMEAVVEALESMRLDYPEIDPAARRAFARARAALEKE
ncbi:MAG: polyphosphate kinase 2 family protein [Alphaproteobacteria bacterium]|nr:polyphosphate kinase 2 family protein [Alphaproteobacteria bacterium]